MNKARIEVRPHVASTDSDIRSSNPDPYEVAARRLQGLLEDADWDNDDLVRAEIGSYPAEMRLTLFSNLGSFATVGAFIISWLCGEDPLGGSSLTEETLEAAFLGVAYAAPLVLCSVVSRTKFMRTCFPVLAHLHHSQNQLLEPFVSELTPTQLTILTSFLVIPGTLLLLPAMKGSLGALYDFVQGGLGSSGMAFHMPVYLVNEFACFLPACFSALFVGRAIANQLAVRESEYFAIRDALQNSDRYFRLTLSMDRNASERVSQTTSQAFKSLAIVWLLMKKKTTQLGFMLTALNITYYGLIWQETGDLATPAVTAMILTLVEFWFVQRATSRS